MRFFSFAAVLLALIALFANVGVEATPIGQCPNHKDCKTCLAHSSEGCVWCSKLKGQPGQGCAGAASFCEKVEKTCNGAAGTSALVATLAVTVALGLTR